MSRVFSPDEPAARERKIKFHSLAEGEPCQACTYGREHVARWRVMTRVGTHQRLVSVCRHCSRQPNLRFWQDHVPVETF